MMPQSGKGSSPRLIRLDELLPHGGHVRGLSTTIHGHGETDGSRRQYPSSREVPAQGFLLTCSPGSGRHPGKPDPRQKKKMA